MNPDSPGSHNYRTKGVMDILFGCEELMVAVVDPDLLESGLIHKLNEILQELERVWVDELDTIQNRYRLHQQVVLRPRPPGLS